MDTLDIGFGIAGIMLMVHVLSYVLLRSNHTMRVFASTLVPFAPQVDVLYDRKGSVQLWENRARVRRITGIAALVTTLWSPVILVALASGITGIILFKVFQTLYRVVGYWFLYRIMFCLPVAAFFAGEDAMGKIMNAIMQKIHEIVALLKKAFSRSKGSSEDDELSFGRDRRTTVDDLHVL